MADRYHITKDGLPGVCKAQHGNCPLGGDDEHYDNKLDALQASERKLEEENDYLASKKKNVTYHVGENGSPEECPYKEGYCKVKPYGRFKNVHAPNMNVVAGAAKAFREAQGSETKKPGNAYGRPVTRQPASPASAPQGAPTPITQEARDVIAGGPTRMTPAPPAGTYRNGTYKVQAGDSIQAQWIKHPGDGCRQGPTYGYERYETLQDALDAGWGPDEIRVVTEASCHHSTTTPDFTDPANLTKSTSNHWRTPEQFTKRTKEEVTGKKPTPPPTSTPPVKSPPKPAYKPTAADTCGHGVSYRSNSRYLGC